jgi:hypothetical protein
MGLQWAKRVDLRLEAPHEQAVLRRGVGPQPKRNLQCIRRHADGSEGPGQVTGTLPAKTQGHQHQRPRHAERDTRVSLAKLAQQEHPSPRRQHCAERPVEHPVVMEEPYSDGDGHP